MFLFLLLLGGANGFIGGGACDLISGAAIAKLGAGGPDIAGDVVFVAGPPIVYDFPNNLLTGFATIGGGVSAPIVLETVTVSGIHVLNMGSNTIQLGGLALDGSAPFAIIADTITLNGITQAGNDLLLCGTVNVLTNFNVNVGTGDLVIESESGGAVNLNGLYGGGSLTFLGPAITDSAAATLTSTSGAITLSSTGNIDIPDTTFNSAAGISVTTTGGFVSTGALTAVTDATLTATATVTVGGAISVTDVDFDGTQITIGSSGTPVAVGITNGGDMTTTSGSIVIFSAAPSLGTTTLNSAACIDIRSTSATGTGTLTAAQNIFAPRAFIEGASTGGAPTNGICDQQTITNTCGTDCSAQCDVSVVTDTVNRRVITTTTASVEVCVATGGCTPTAGCSTATNPLADIILAIDLGLGGASCFEIQGSLTGGTILTVSGGGSDFDYTGQTFTGAGIQADSNQVAAATLTVGSRTISVTQVDDCSFDLFATDMKRKRQTNPGGGLPVIVPVTPAAAGDPHLVGPHNQKYDFVGTPDSKGNSIFTLFSTPQYLINMQLKQAGPEGRYIDHLFFQFQNVTFNVDMRHEVHTPFGRFVDAKLRTVGGRAKASAYELVVELCDGHTFVVNQMSNYQADFINLNVHVPGCHNSFDGALGQMYKCNYKDLDFSKQAEEKFRLDDIQQFSGLFDPENKCPHPSVFAGRTPLQGATMMK